MRTSPTMQKTVAAAKDWVSAHPGRTVAEMIAALKHPVPEGFGELTEIADAKDSRVLVDDNGDLVAIERDWQMRDDSGGDWVERGTWGERGDVYPTDADIDRIAEAYRQCMVDAVDDWSKGTYWSGYSGVRPMYWWDSDGERWLESDSSQIGIEIAAHVAMDPPEPECAAGEHRWISPYELVGGIEENPGVHGNAGGVIVTEVCALCGTRRTTDTWAQDPSTGEQGLTAVWYDRLSDDDGGRQAWWSWLLQNAWVCNVTFDKDDSLVDEVDIVPTATGYRADLPGFVVSDGATRVYDAWADEDDTPESLNRRTGLDADRHSLRPAWLTWDSKDESWDWHLGEAV